MSGRSSSCESLSTGFSRSCSLNNLAGELFVASHQDVSIRGGKIWDVISRNTFSHVSFPIEANESSILSPLGAPCSLSTVIDLETSNSRFSTESAPASSRHLEPAYTLPAQGGREVEEEQPTRLEGKLPRIRILPYVVSPTKQHHGNAPMRRTSDEFVMDVACPEAEIPPSAKRMYYSSTSSWSSSDNDSLSYPASDPGPAFVTPPITPRGHHVLTGQGNALRSFLFSLAKPLFGRGLKDWGVDDLEDPLLNPPGKAYCSHPTSPQVAHTFPHNLLKPASLSPPVAGQGPRQQRHKHHHRHHKRHGHHLRQQQQMQHKHTHSHSHGHSHRGSAAALDTGQPFPFVLKFTVATFGICMGVCSHSYVWKLLAHHPEAVPSLLQAPPMIGELLWAIGCLLLTLFSLIYAAKLFHWPQSAAMEYMHPVRTNFFFTPFISALFLMEGAPQGLMDYVHPGRDAHPLPLLLFMAPILALDLQIFGEWMSQGYHRLSAVANPTTQISIIGNFIGAKVGVMCGWTDLALFFFSVGAIHQIIVFVTLYQRLEGNFLMPQDMHPLFFLFVAPPCAASIAWSAIVGHMDKLGKALFFIGLFMYLQMVRQYHLFKDLRFSLAWWAYTFPMNAAVCASILYTLETESAMARCCTAFLTVVSCTTFILVSGRTCWELVQGTLFANDPVVASCLKFKQHVHERVITKFHSDAN